MASEQSMAQAIVQAAIKATKAEIKAVRKTEIPVKTKRPVPAVSKRQFSAKAAHFQLEISR